MDKEGVEPRTVLADGRLGNVYINLSRGLAMFPFAKGREKKESVAKNCISGICPQDTQSGSCQKHNKIITLLAMQGTSVKSHGPKLAGEVRYPPSITTRAEIRVAISCVFLVYLKLLRISCAIHLLSLILCFEHDIVLQVNFVNRPKIVIVPIFKMPE